jgi:hypothetical protein
MEEFHSDIPFVPFSRSAVAAGTGVTTPPEQPNVLNSYPDAEAVYGTTPERLTWMRDGARLLMPDNLLPRRDARGDLSTAPRVDDPVGMGPRAVVGQPINHLLRQVHPVRRPVRRPLQQQTDLFGFVLAAEARSELGHHAQLPGVCRMITR